MLKELLYFVVEIIAKFHTKILSLNDRFEYNFTDKELHFLVIGILGMAMIFVIYPLFKWLAKKNHVMVIAWFYVLTVIVVITFAIEIGQKATNTGAMEFADIVFGIVGYVVMFLIFGSIRSIYKGIRKLIKSRREVSQDSDEQVDETEEDCVDEADDEIYEDDETEDDDEIYVDESDVIYADDED